MKTISSLLSFVVAMISASNAVNFDYSDYYYILFGPQHPCKATLVGENGDIQLKTCSPFDAIDKAAEKSRVTRIDLKIILLKSGDPGLDISFKAKSQIDFVEGTSQVYRINVHSGTEKLYCGIIKSPKPKPEIASVFSLRMTCNPKTLIPRRGIDVRIEPGNNRTSKNVKKSNITIPGCVDPLMYRSNECEDFRRYRIKFQLRQVGNSTMAVSLDLKSAYRGNRNERIFMQLRVQRRSRLAGWEPVGPITRMLYPQANHSFSNLIPGEVYSVLLWRNSDGLRQYQTLTLKSQYRRV